MYIIILDIKINAIQKYIGYNKYETKNVYKVCKVYKVKNL